MSPSAEILLAAIRRRRSFKSALLKPDELPRDLIETVLEAARWAPSHGQTEPWHFTVYTGEARQGLSEAYAAAFQANAGAKGIYTPEGHEAARRRAFEVPVSIALTLRPALKPDGTPVMPELEEMLALACAVQNLHLMASALGLGGMWSTGLLATHPLVEAFVNIPKPSRLMGFFTLGWPRDAWPEARRKDPAEIVTWA